LHEGFGLSVLEGLKCGCPSIDHKFTSTSEISGEGGIHVDMNSAEALKEAISLILNNPDVLVRLRSKCIERSKMFTWERTVENLVEFYKS
jgi:glycosyltransferase involved in cell wall biosynthesis